jgi:hypothetical protein
VTRCRHAAPDGPAAVQDDTPDGPVPGRRGVLDNEPLLLAGPAEGVLGSAFRYGAEALYFGTGLATPRSPSVGVPFDILVLVLVAEKLRRTLGMRRIVHHIADTHALCNGFSTAGSVAALAGEYREVMRRIVDATGFPIRISLASEFDGSDEYGSLLRSGGTDGLDPYVRREIADMAWYVRTERVGLKLGWLVQRSGAGEGFDERRYDREFARVFPADGLAFAYTVCGRTFDCRRPRVCPYVSVEGERRILLARDERVHAKVEAAAEAWDARLGGAVKHLNMIVRLWDKLTPAPTGRGTVPDRVQRIIDTVFA